MHILHIESGRLSRKNWAKNVKAPNGCISILSVNASLSAEFESSKWLHIHPVS